MAQIEQLKTQLGQNITSKGQSQSGSTRECTKERDKGISTRPI